MKKKFFYGLAIFISAIALGAAPNLCAQGLFGPAKPSTVEELHSEFTGNELKFLLGVRAGRADEIAGLLGALDFTSSNHKDEEIADAWGLWRELSEDWNWKKGMPLEIRKLDFGAELFIFETYLQAKVSDSSEVWSILAPLLERLVLSSYLWNIALLAERGKELRDLVSNRINLDARLAVYRFGGGQIAREPAICYLQTEGILKTWEMEIFLEAGADPDVQCINGFTPLIGAAWNGFEYQVKLLLRFGADPNKSRQGGTPMQAVIEAPHLSEETRESIMKLLAEHGAHR